ncbi:MAG: creatininase family protein [Pseudomonadota bacterium]
MRLAVSTWTDIDAWLERSDTIVLPIGSFEQHGPNGFIGTDALCPEIIANHAEANASEDILVGPTFNVGCAQHHLAFAGTITLRPSTMMANILDWTDSLVRHGFRKFFWLNGHGGNVATIQAAFAEIRARRSLAANGEETEPELTLTLRNWWDYKEVKNLCEELYPVGHGMHATASEVSVTYFGYPDRARSDVKMSPKIAPIGRIGDALQYRRDFPDGRIGSDPTQSSAEDGARIVETAANCVIRELQRGK